jgi:dCTP diphosphatase
MPSKSFQNLTKELRAFARERDWDQFHSPKNLAMALSVEVAEVLEHFQWMPQASP